MEINANIFSNDQITVTYDPKCCANAGNCIRQLSNVFRTSIIPWIDLDAADTDSIINQIKNCPSGALKYYVSNKEVA